MNRVHPHFLAGVLALFLAGWHAVWAALVWSGAAQPLLDFVFRLHMITPPYTVAPFEWRTAALLIVFTAGVGYVAGWAAGMIWNRLMPRHELRHGRRVVVST